MSVVYKNRGQYESNWVPIALDTGFTSSDGVYYKVVGNMCFLKGTVTRTAGNWTTTATTFITSAPSDARPLVFARRVVNGGPTSTNGIISVGLSSSGTFQAWVTGTAVSDTLYLGSLSYRVA